MKMDMHCHVQEGSVDSGVTIDAYIRKLKSEGFDGMMIADHDTYNGYRYWKENMEGKVHQDFVVLRSIEYDTIDGGHILCILPENVHLKLMEVRGLKVASLIDFVHRHGGVLGPAHPFGPRFMSVMHASIYQKEPEILEQFDFIETYNSCEDEESNQKAKELAWVLGKPGTGGSDSHKIDCVGLAYTILPEAVATESDLIDQIKGHAEFVTGGSHFSGTTKDRIGKWNDLLVYGYWPYNWACALMERGKRRRLSREENAPLKAE